MVNRIFNPLKSNSFFVFGPRGTGKTTWLKKHFSQQKHLWIDLLEVVDEERFAAQPQLLAALIDKQRPKWVIIDEIQKNPKLLDIVHLEIEKRSALFVLTGSSARKLKRGAANMLAGRAFLYHMHPLTHIEYSTDFDLKSSLSWGDLPKLLEFTDDREKIAYLKAYTQTYLKEEILLEQIVRKLDPFRRFLAIAAQQNGEIINYTNIAKDVGSDVKTVQSYFQILEDTLVGFLLPAYHKSVRKQQSQNPKFYFFDTGVMHTLAGTRSLDRNSDLYGVSFEQFIGMELKSYLSYRRIKDALTFWRTSHGFEVDYLIGEHTAIEVKATRNVAAKHSKGLKALASEKMVEKMFLITHDPIATKKDGIHAMHWESFLGELWNGKII